MGNLNICLPPDPEGMNDQRAAWAGVAVERFRHEVGLTHPDDTECALVDLLADLRHWADRRGIDFDTANRTACGAYTEETCAVEVEISAPPTVNETEEALARVMAWWQTDTSFEGDMPKELFDAAMALVEPRVHQIITEAEEDATWW